VDFVVARFLSVVRPGLGVYCVTGRFFSAFGPGLGVVADKAESKTMAGSIGTLAGSFDYCFALTILCFNSCTI
jgi:hypothetical protein